MQKIRIRWLTFTISRSQYHPIWYSYFCWKHSSLTTFGMSSYCQWWKFQNQTVLTLIKLSTKWTFLTEGRLMIPGSVIRDIFTKQTLEIMQVLTLQAEEQSVWSLEKLQFVVMLQHIQDPATNTCSVVSHCVFFLFDSRQSLLRFSTAMPKVAKSPYPKLTSPSVIYRVWSSNFYCNLKSIDETPALYRYAEVLPNVYQIPQAIWNRSKKNVLNKLLTRNFALALIFNKVFMAQI